MTWSDPKNMMAQAVAQTAAPDPAAVAAAAHTAGPLGPHVMQVILALMVIALVVSIWKAQKDDSISFNVFDLVVGPDGRLVPENCIVMCAFGLHSWALVGWIVVGVVTTADFTAYGGIWVAPTIAKLLRGRQQYPKEIEAQVAKLVADALAKTKGEV